MRAIVKKIASLQSHLARLVGLSILCRLGSGGAVFAVPAHLVLAPEIHFDRWLGSQKLNVFLWGQKLHFALVVLFWPMNHCQHAGDGGFHCCPFDLKPACVAKGKDIVCPDDMLAKDDGFCWEVCRELMLVSFQAATRAGHWSCAQCCLLDFQCDVELRAPKWF